MKWKSLAQWPDKNVCVGNTDNITEDWHYTEIEAKNICQMLEKYGFGGDREIFPIKTWVEEIKEK